MKLSITIDSDNDACQTKSEVIALLKKTIEKIKNASERLDGGRILDINGNSVGEWEIRN